MRTSLIGDSRRLTDSRCRHHVARFRPGTAVAAELPQQPATTQANAILPIPPRKKFSEARDPGCHFWRSWPIPADGDRAIACVRWQSHGNLKAIPTTLGKRICAALRGGGRILPQTVSNPKFPANRENNREFLNFRPFFAISAPNR
jgi:hypothetical protein